MRTFLTLGFLIVPLAAVCEAREGPKPPQGRTPATIDYKKPSQYARIPKSAGNEKAVRKLAKKLKGASSDRTFLNIHTFMKSNVLHIPEGGWRAEHWNFDRLVEGFDHSGCASHALVFANLTRACGIPAVYVKSSRHQWIRKFVATGQTGYFSGHVFLEVHLKGKWCLLDCQGMRIWEDYDPGNPELPGGLYAYEKGWDHYAMVHSTRRDDFKREAVARWKGFDVSTLRKNERAGRSLLPTAYAATLSGEWKVLEQRIQSLRSFNLGYWKKAISGVKGNLFVITSMGGDVGVPKDEVDQWLPVGLDQLAKEFAKRESHVRTRLRDDGTLVVLVSAPGWAELMTLIWRTDFEAMRTKHANR